MALLVPSVLFAQGITVGDITAQIERLLAQVRELQAQIRALQAGSATPASSTGVQYGVCRVSRTLTEGEQSDDVRALQEFLRTEGYLSANATGYFGPLTRGALRGWQAAQGIVSSGDALTTGWGVFGPRTRERVQEWCGGSVQSTPPTQTTPSTGHPQDDPQCKRWRNEGWCSGGGIREVPGGPSMIYMPDCALPEDGIIPPSEPAQCLEYF